jgi:hypothetical protein
MFSPALPGIQDRLHDLELRFAEYTQAFRASPPFGSLQLRSHLRTLDLRRSFASASDAARDSGFADSLFETLQLWDIGVRFTKLVPLIRFREQLRGISMAVAQLEQLRIDDPAMDATRVARLANH